MKAKKLIAPQKLAELQKLRTLGVPIKRLLLDHNIDMTIPTLVKLLDVYADFEVDKNIETYNALFPAWIVPHIESVQIQPNKWRFYGKFPKGKWIKDRETV